MARVAGANPGHKIALDEAPAAADLGAGQAPTANMGAHRVGMDLEERGGAPQRQEGLLGPRFAAVE